MARLYGSCLLLAITALAGDEQAKTAAPEVRMVLAAEHSPSTPRTEVNAPRGFIAAVSALNDTADKPRAPIYFVIDPQTAISPTEQTIRVTVIPKMPATHIRLTAAASEGLAIIGTL